MKKNKIPYPENILSDIFANPVYNFGNDGKWTDVKIENISDDQKSGLEYAMQTALNERDRQIVYQHYSGGRTLRDIAKDIEISPERVRQIVKKSCRILRRSKYAGYCYFGLAGNTRRIAEAEAIRARDTKEAFDILDKIERLKGVGGVSIDKLSIPYKSWAVLKRNGIETVGDIQGKTDEEMLHLRGLGMKNLSYIRESVADYVEKYNAVDRAEWIPAQYPGEMICAKCRSIVLAAIPMYEYCPRCGQIMKVIDDEEMRAKICEHG